MCSLLPGISRIVCRPYSRGSNKVRRFSIDIRPVESWQTMAMKLAQPSTHSTTSRFASVLASMAFRYSRLDIIVSAVLYRRVVLWWRSMRMAWSWALIWFLATRLHIRYSQRRVHEMIGSKPAWRAENVSRKCFEHRGVPSIKSSEIDEILSDSFLLSLFFWPVGNFVWLLHA